MNKLETKLANAIQNFEYKKTDNTLINPIGHILQVYLHGSVIAEYNRKTKQLKLTDAGWCTRTTVSRLNMVLKAFGLNAIHARIHKGITEFVLDKYVFATSTTKFNCIHL